MALDEPKDTDEKHQLDGMAFVIDKALLEQLGGVKVDYMDAGWRSGFVVSSDKPVMSGPSSCGSSSCSC